MNVRGRIKASAVFLSLALAGCGGTPHPAGVGSLDVKEGAAAYEAVPDTVNGFDVGAIQPGDRLAISVLGEPDLTNDRYVVDGDGKMQVPLVGEVQAAGRSAGQLRTEITEKLAAQFIRNPYVSISIAEHAKFSLTVEGEVQHAGRFEVSPGMTLLGALAMAQSTTKDAKLTAVYVFRELNGRRMGARFDLNMIRKGESADPQIVPGDVVVVGRSAIKSTWHELIAATPLTAVFYYLK
jgi:polysaccharide biosynthesis/export protein